MDINGVQFNDKFSLPNNPRFQAGKPSKMVGWVIKFSGGYIKNEKQANYALLAVAVIAVVVAILNFSSGNSQKVNFPVNAINPDNAGSPADIQSNQ